MRALAEFIRNQQPDELRRLALVLLLSLLAVLVGFVAVGLPAAEWMLRHLGYWFMLGLVLVFGFSLARLWGTSGFRLSRVWQEHRRGALTVLVCSACLLAMDRVAYKVQFDEQVIQATAQNLHLTKEVGALVRTYTLSGSQLPLEAMLDKRPFLLPFLGSVLHDLTGYRTLNLFLLNAALVPVLLGLVYHIGCRLVSKAGGIVSVLVLTTLPVLGQAATGTGLEVINLAMLAATLAAAIGYVRDPGSERLAVLCLCAVLLSQCRYESVLFALPAGLCVLWGWWRVRRILLPWQACVTPLLFIPYALHNRVLSATPRLWQLGEGQSSRFSVSYLADNLEGARRYLFVHDRDLGASLLLAYLGVACLLALPWVLRRVRPVGEDRPVLGVVGLFGLFVAGNLGMLMFYYWARLDDPVASRFSLPLYLMLALVIGLVTGLLFAGRPRAWGLGAAMLFVYAMAVLRPATAHAFYTEYNLSARVIEWETDFISRMPPRERLVIGNRSILPFTIERVAGVPRQGVEASLDRIRFHLEARTFEEVLVLQTLRPGSAEGDYYLDPADALPSGWETRVLAEKRFGAVLERISVLVSMPAPVAAASASSGT